MAPEMAEMAEMDKKEDTPTNQAHVSQSISELLALMKFGAPQDAEEALQRIKCTKLYDQEAALNAVPRAELESALGWCLWRLQLEAIEKDARTAANQGCQSALSNDINMLTFRLNEQQQWLMESQARNHDLLGRVQRLENCLQEANAELYWRRNTEVASMSSGITRSGTSSHNQLGYLRRLQSNLDKKTAALKACEENLESVTGKLELDLNAVLDEREVECKRLSDTLALKGYENFDANNSSTEVSSGITAKTKLAEVMLRFRKQSKMLLSLPKWLTPAGTSPNLLAGFAACNELTLPSSRSETGSRTKSPNLLTAPTVDSSRHDSVITRSVKSSRSASLLNANVPSFTPATSTATTVDSSRHDSVMTRSSRSASLLNPNVPAFCPTSATPSGDGTPHATITETSMPAAGDHIRSETSDIQTADEGSNNDPQQDGGDQAASTTPGESHTPAETEAVKRSSKSCPPPRERRTAFDSADDEVERFIAEQLHPDSLGRELQRRASLGARRLRRDHSP